MLAASKLPTESNDQLLTSEDEVLTVFEYSTFCSVRVIIPTALLIVPPAKLTVFRSRPLIEAKAEALVSWSVNEFVVTDPTK